MGKTRTGKAAVGLTALAFLLVLIAFTTPNWLQNDGVQENSKFRKIGLWQVCFNNFKDIRHLYDTQFYGCQWVFTEDFYIIHDILLPDFFVWTQFLFSVCFTLLVIGSFLAALYLCCSRHHNKYLLLLWSTGTNLTISGIFGVIACLVFGGRLHYRDWMPNWEHNNPGWSYALACIGSLVLLGAGILFMVEARRFRKKIDRMIDEELKSQASM